jgi:hypothetical protein
MSAQRIYIFLILLTLICLSLLLVSVPLSYYLYGFPSGIRQSGSLDSFEAARKTLQIRMWILGIAVIVDFICFIYSLVTVFLGLKVHKWLAYCVSVASLLLLIFYGLIYILGKMSGIMLS